MYGEPSEISVPRASGDKPEKETFTDTKGRVFPAPAGINPRNLLFGGGDTRVPRASGDKPGDRFTFALTLQVFPAPAGINLIHSYNVLLQRKCSPRQRG